jgi:hypothetical protein
MKKTLITLALLAAVVSTPAVAWDSYTVQPWGNGQRIQNDMDPMDSYTVQPWGNGQRIQNTWDPMDSYTVQPWGNGQRIQRTFPKTNSSFSVPQPWLQR